MPLATVDAAASLPPSPLAADPPALSLLEVHAAPAESTEKPLLSRSDNEERVGLHPAMALGAAAGPTWDYSAPDVVYHVFWAVLLGGLALFGTSLTVYLIWAGSISFLLAPLLLAVDWLFLAGLLRQLHALRVRPHFRLTPEAIHLRYWKSVDLLEMVRPTHHVVEAVIPWSEFRGIVNSCG
jgi:hypothetical protein